jgi:hypothetical protein
VQVQYKVDNIIMSLITCPPHDRADNIIMSLITCPPHDRDDNIIMSLITCPPHGRADNSIMSLITCPPRGRTEQFLIKQQSLLHIHTTSINSTTVTVKCSLPCKREGLESH